MTEELAGYDEYCITDDEIWDEDPNNDRDSWFAARDIGYRRMLEIFHRMGYLTTEVYNELYATTIEETGLKEVKPEVPLAITQTINNVREKE